MGIKGGIIYDYNIKIGARIVGKFRRLFSVGYVLTDAEGRDVRRKDNSIIIIQTISQFQNIYDVYAHLLPTEEELAKRKAAAEEQHRQKMEENARNARREKLTKYVEEMFDLIAQHADKIGEPAQNLIEKINQPN